MKIKVESYGEMAILLEAHKAVLTKPSGCNIHDVAEAVSMLLSVNAALLRDLDKQ